MKALSSVYVATAHTPHTGGAPPSLCNCAEKQRAASLSHSAATVQVVEVGSTRWVRRQTSDVGRAATTFTRSPVPRPRSSAALARRRKAAMMSEIRAGANKTAKAVQDATENDTKAEKALKEFFNPARRAAPCRPLLAAPAWALARRLRLV